MLGYTDSTDTRSPLEHAWVFITIYLAALIAGIQQCAEKNQGKYTAVYVRHGVKSEQTGLFNEVSVKDTLLNHAPGLSPASIDSILAEHRPELRQEYRLPGLREHIGSERDRFRVYLLKESRNPTLKAHWMNSVPDHSQRELIKRIVNEYLDARTDSGAR